MQPCLNTITWFLYEEAERAKILAGTSFENLSPKSISEDTQVAV